MLTIKNSSGTQFPAPLVYVSPTQINLEVPKGVSAGTATFTVANGSTLSAPGQIQNVAPTLFSMNGNGTEWRRRRSGRRRRIRSYKPQ